ncbi:ABC transporter substrate-binding protein [Burkholderiaceae bacterium 16]|nr:ABC transporter substrate-binding protein [Burkholderiaceae bacterium 16]
MKCIRWFTRNGRALMAGGAMALCFASQHAIAQAWPAKPVRIVTAAPPGGTADMLARSLADGLSKQLGQSFIVDSKPGGFGAIAVQDVLAAPHDGYTLLVIQDGIASEIPFLSKLRFDPFNDIKPLAELARGGLVLVGNPKLPARDLPELIRYIKAHPASVNYASYSSGMLGHTMGLQLNRLAGIDMSHVGYKGSPPALQDVMGGHVPLMFDGTATSLPLIKAGKLHAFAVSSPKRLAVLPQVPTFTELGYPGLNQVAWIGLWATPDVPEAIQERLRAATRKVLETPAVRDRIAELGLDAGLPKSQAELSASLHAAHDRQGALLKAIDFKPE